MNPFVRFLARFGCFSIGTVYILIGTWAMLALLRIAEPAADEERILQRMLAFPLGEAFIAVIALGLGGYILWRIYEAIFDPYEFGHDLKGLAERIGIGLSASVYGLIAFAAVKVLLGRGGNGEEKQQLMAGRVLEWPGGEWMLGALGLAVAAFGLYQIKYVHGGSHKQRVRMDRFPTAVRKGVDVLGWIGFLARCAILLVLGGFLVAAAWSGDPGKVGDTDSAFDFLGLGGGALGDLVFSLVALGTIAYGLFMYVNGVYFNFDED